MTINPPSTEDLAKLSHSNRVKFAVFCAEQVHPLSIQELKRDADKRRKARQEETLVMKFFTDAESVCSRAIKIAHSYAGTRDGACEIQYRAAYAAAIQKANVVNILAPDVAYTAVYLLAHARAATETPNDSDDYSEDYMSTYDSARIPVIRAQWKYYEELANET
jgi:hypothetical protein